MEILILVSEHYEYILRNSCACEQARVKSPCNYVKLVSETQVVSLLSTQCTVIAHLDFGCIRLSSLYLAREGSHLRCSMNDAEL